MIPLGAASLPAAWKQAAFRAPAGWPAASVGGNGRLWRVRRPVGRLLAGCALRGWRAEGGSGLGRAAPQRGHWLRTG